MTPRELDQSYHEKKESFHAYIDTIKKNNLQDIYTIINTTLVKNPFISTFPKDYFSKKTDNTNKIYLFFKSITIFYAKNIYLLVSYFIAFMLFKRYYVSPKERSLHTLFDVFVLVDKTNRENAFNENYLLGVYDLFEKYNKPYTIIPRLYSIGRNPFKLVQLLKIINKEKKKFLFEFELLSLRDFRHLLILIILYPFKTLRLLQPEILLIDRCFNQSLIHDIKMSNLEEFKRYIFGINLSKFKEKEINTIYTWNEFQVIERSFNYGLRTQNDRIKIIGCQPYINYETYFNSYIDDIDYDSQSSPHEVFVNGAYYLLKREKIIYRRGVSLRYSEIFTFPGIKGGRNIILLGSYFENETKYLLESTRNFENVIFKNHPALDIAKLGPLPDTITLSDESIYTLFETAEMAIGTASGTAIEAVACGISVLILASQENLTANPLTEYGKGRIWDIAYSTDEIPTLYDKLIMYRKENMSEIQKVAEWYKDNFFIEPTEHNILKAFDIEIKGK